ncbi:MAG: hypothetical protein JW881_13685 [Spirochaetales bacterium]|nr:hypothetical protein [Spirochaetales bacterium]
MKRKFVFCIAAFLTAQMVCAAFDCKRIAVVPFINNGELEYEKLGDYIPSYLIMLLKDREDYHVNQLQDVKQAMARKGYRREDLKNMQVLKAIADELKSDYIIGGFLNEEGNLVYVTPMIYRIDESGMNMDSRVIGMDFDGTDLFAVNGAFEKLVSFIEEILGIIIDPGFLTVMTDAACTLSVDGYDCGNTPIQIPLGEGGHRMTVTHSSADGEETVYAETFRIGKGEHLLRDVRVFRRLCVNAEEKCTVFINGEERGPTPFETDLYAGRDYQLKLLYYHDDGRIIQVSNKIISTRDELPPYYFTSRASVTIECPPPFEADAGTGESIGLPATIDDLVPGSRRIRVLLADATGSRRWVFYDRRIDLAPFQSLTLDPGDFGYRRNLMLALIPSAAQFHNREPVKGWIVLAGILAAGTAIGLTARQWAYWGGEYDGLWDARINPPEGWVGAITEAEKQRDMYCLLFAGACVLFGGIYVYSAVDGVVTMNGMDGLIHSAD